MPKGSRKRFREPSPAEHDSSIIQHIKSFLTSEEAAKRFRKIPEFDFPEPIIQLIQSFLTSKEAAQTTVLSKSWRRAWLTRPNLDFHLRTVFCNRTYDGYKVSRKYMEFAEKTLERYETSNLKIDSFRLEMKTQKYDMASSKATELVHRALKLGPTHLTFEFDVVNRDFDIPDEVFRHENLLSLIAIGCRINKLNREGVCCSRLQSLSLQCVRMESRDMIFHIISSCPLIEELLLCNVNADDDSYGGESVVDDDGMQTIICPLHRLKSLVLKHVYFDTLFLADLSSKFPSLKDFTLFINHARGDQTLISSPTLEYLHLQLGCSRNSVHKVKLNLPSIRNLTFVCFYISKPNVKLNVPRIRKLTLECSSIPKLSVKSNSRGWESCISLTRRKCLGASWFYRLNHFLNKLRFSRIYLSLHVSSQTTFYYEPGDIRGLAKPEIENLDIYHEHLPTQSCYVLFDGLFLICHPKLITQYMPNYSRSVGRLEAKNIRFLGKILLEARDANVPNPATSQYMYGLNDLKEARIQVFDEDFNEWRDEEPLDALSNYNGSYYIPTPETYRHQKLRFRFYWDL